MYCVIKSLNPLLCLVDRLGVKCELISAEVNFENFGFFKFVYDLSILQIEDALHLISFNLLVFKKRWLQLKIALSPSFQNAFTLFIQIPFLHRNCTFHLNIMRIIKRIRRGVSFLTPEELSC